MNLSIRHKKTAIRRQIAILTLCSVLTVILLSSVFIIESRRLTREKTSVFIHTMLETLGSGLERIGNDMRFLGDSLCSNEIVQQYLHASDASKRMEYGQTFTKLTASLLSNSTSVSQIVLVDTKQVILSATERNIVALDTLDRNYSLLSESRRVTGFFGPAYDTYWNTNLFAYVLPVYNTMPGGHVNQKLATLLIFGKVENLSSLLKNSVASPNASLLLVDADDNIITASRAYDAVALPVHTEKAHSTVIIDDTSLYLDYIPINSLGWKLVSLLPVDEISVDLTSLYSIGILICVISSLIIIIWGIQIRYSIATPLGQLTHFIEHDLDADLKNRIYLNNAPPEIELLGSSINALLDKVSDMTDTIVHNKTHLYELTLAKNRAELSALQSQINPHFLYNTLDCLRGYGYMLNSSEIVTIANSLSTIMRYCIKGSATVALSTEMKIVNNYLDIINIRFAGRFRFVIDADDDVQDVSIPRFILEPVVENAIYHGLETRLEGGCLTISCHRKGDNCCITVTDNGAGMAEEGLAELKQRLRTANTDDYLNVPAGHGLGLVNIHRRLISHYGEGYGLDICRPAEGGLQVSILVPFLTATAPHKAQDQ